MRRQSDPRNLILRLGAVILVGMMTAVHWVLYPATPEYIWSQMDLPAVHAMGTMPVARPFRGTGTPDSETLGTRGKLESFSQMTR